jgi:hypothetical protein
VCRVLPRSQAATDFVSTETDSRYQLNVIGRM